MPLPRWPVVNSVRSKADGRQEVVIVRLDRTIQYAAVSRSDHQRLWNTGSPAFADDDERECGAFVLNDLTPIQISNGQTTVDQGGTIRTSPSSLRNGFAVVAGGARPCARLEGWQRVPALRPSFETLASQAPQDEVGIFFTGTCATP
jgi:hypothetical protein